MTPLHRLALALLSCYFLSWISTAATHQEEEMLQTNLALAQDLIRESAKDVLRRSGVSAGEHIVLRVERQEESWITEQAVASEFRASGHDVALALSEVPAEGILIEIHHPSVSVRYSDPIDQGLFGRGSVRRTISAEFSCLVTVSPGGAVRLSDTVRRSRSDTVRVESIPGIESAGLSSTSGELPQGRFIDRIVEPFVIVGATGVVVYLLFNIRS